MDVKQQNLSHDSFRAQELCGSRGGRPGLHVRNNSPYGFCGRKATLNQSRLIHPCRDYSSAQLVCVLLYSKASASSHCHVFLHWPTSSLLPLLVLSSPLWQRFDQVSVSETKQLFQFSFRLYLLSGLSASVRSSQHFERESSRERERDRQKLQQQQQELNGRKLCTVTAELDPARHHRHHSACLNRKRTAWCGGSAP